MQPRGEAKPRRSPENRRFEKIEDFCAKQQPKAVRVSVSAEGVNAAARSEATQRCIA